MKKYFYLESSPYEKGWCTLRVNSSEMPFSSKVSGSYNILAARVMNLRVAWYLRYCRDRLGARLVGKKGKYITPYFKNTAEVRMFVMLLNKRMEFLMNKQENPYIYTKEGHSVVRTPIYEEVENETE